MGRSPQLAHRRLAALVSGLALLAPACHTRGITPPKPAVRHLASVGETVEIRPGESKTASFRLVDDAQQPVAGEEIRFAIVDNPETPVDEANGATLTADRDLTDADGIGHALVVGGLPTVFRLDARATGANPANAVVVVGNGGYGSAEIAPFFPPGSAAFPLTATVEVALYDGRSCEGLSPTKPPPPVRDPKSMPVDGAATFTSVATDSHHAVLGRARDGAGMVRAAGCVDLPGGTLVPGGLVALPLLLGDLRPSPLGTFAVTSRFLLDKLPKGAQAAAPWNDLANCPLDPGQIWLDCTLDALSGDSADDPLDCVPQNEGLLGTRLAARRGMVAAGGCRSMLDASGQPSTDARVAALFPADSAIVKALPGLGDGVAAVLQAVTVDSTLALTATSIPGRHQGEHTLQFATFGEGTQARIDLAALALPGLVAPFVPVAEQEGQVQVGRHGMTLRLGTAARAAFSRLALLPRGLPPSSFELAAAIASQAQRNAPEGDMHGCEALDALLCLDSGEPRGCLGTACAEGVTALGRRLDAGFLNLDGDDVDLLIEGSAVIVDADGNGLADRLGDDTSSPPRPGLWVTELRTRAGSTSLTGTWTAARKP